MSKEKTVAVLGLGLFGVSVARTLAKNGVDVIAMDKNMDHVEEVSGYIANAMQGDLTRYENLEAALIGTCDIAIVATGELLEVTITAIFHLKKLGVPYIIVKTKNKMYQDVLLKVGADRVVLPEKELGVELGCEISQARVQDLLELDEDYHIIEIESPSEWINQSLIMMKLMEKERINVLGVKSLNDQRYSFLVEPNYIFKKGDRVVILSGNKEINDDALKSMSDDE